MSFTYNWNLSDLKAVKKNGLKVFSCFSCAGGSTMGYKMSGFEVLGCNEIEQKIADLYVKNHRPKHCFVQPIQEFKKRDDLPEELFDLDILDGSPPCSTFSMAGSREKKWGSENKFREGQISQRLDDLYFDFLDLAEKLRPKVIISENVKGMLLGNAKGYVKQILARLDKMGYTTQLFLIDGSDLGLPQRRQRVFFVSSRIGGKVDLSFKERKVSVKQAFTSIKDINTRGKSAEKSVNAKYWHMAKEGESFSKYHPKGSLFNLLKLDRKRPAPTIIGTSQSTVYHYESNRFISDQEVSILSSFPKDYDFCGYKVGYLCGMSVPPLMMHKISERVRDQIFGGSDV